MYYPSPQVFFVATDEVAFDFMERIVPGQVSLLPVLGSVRILTSLARSGFLVLFHLTIIYLTI